MKTKKNTAVIGGGAAGLMSAYLLAMNGIEADLYEKNQKLGLKLGITGKGRCNVTNNCDRDTFLSNVVTNPKFLYGAFANFSPEDMMNMLQNGGVPLITERGNRVFPQSDRALDIVSFFLKGLNNSSVSIIRKEVKDVVLDDGFAVVTDSGEALYDNIIICTGGVSYPQTGSTGDGYSFAKKLGHTVIAPMPALVPMESNDSCCKEMQGLSLKNVTLTLVDADEKKVYSQLGEMLFTHFGISGPLVLSASSLVKSPKGCTVYIDLKPALDEKTLDARLLRDFSEVLNKEFKNSLSGILPQKMIPVVVKKSGIDPFKQVNTVTKEERTVLVNLLKNFPIEISGFRPISEAIITSGGVSVKEINAKTMESKICPGLYFAGEVIDVDALTGGFNLQIAFSTAATAVDAIIEKQWS